jgi:hypothetical protein
MDRREDYDMPPVQTHLLPRKPASPYQSYNQGSSSTLRADPYSYQPYDPYTSVSETYVPHSETYLPPVAEMKSPTYVTVAQPQDHGSVIQPPWRRYLWVWLLALLTVCAFVATSLFAWNATGGSHADSRFLFSDPGRTILTLQLLTNFTTALFGELLIASFEAVRPTPSG